MGCAVGIFEIELREWALTKCSRLRRVPGKIHSSNVLSQVFVESVSTNIIVLGERHQRWVLKRCVRYYLDSRSHLSLAKDSPNSRPVQSIGQIIAIPQVGGLHHRYERRAA